MNIQYVFSEFCVYAVGWSAATATTKDHFGRYWLDKPAQSYVAGMDIGGDMPMEFDVCYYDIGKNFYA